MATVNMETLRRELANKIVSDYYATRQTARRGIEKHKHSTGSTCHNFTTESHTVNKPDPGMVMLAEPGCEQRRTNTGPDSPETTTRITFLLTIFDAKIRRQEPMGAQDHRWRG